MTQPKVAKMMEAEQTEEALILDTFEKVADLEEQLDALEHEHAIAEAKLDLEYDRKKAPLIKKRNEVLAKVPQFWLTALLNHSLFSVVIEEQDKQVLSYLTAIEVERPDNDDDANQDCNTYRLVFRFAQPNPFLDTDTLVKEIVVPIQPDAAGEGEFQFRNMSTIPWKEGKNVMVTEEADGKRKARDSFFEFFQDESTDAMELFNIYLSDFVPNVLSYYQGIDEEDEDEELEEIDLEEMSNDEEEEEEEEEEAAGN